MRKIFLVLMAAIVLFGGCSFVPEYLRPSGEKIVSPNFVVERITVCEELKDNKGKPPIVCVGNRRDNLANDLSNLFEETLLRGLVKKGIRPIIDLPVRLLVQIAPKNQRFVYIALTMKLSPDLILDQNEAGNGVVVEGTTVKITLILKGVIPLLFPSLTKEAGIMERRMTVAIAEEMVERVDKYFAAVAAAKSGKKT